MENNLIEALFDITAVILLQIFVYNYKPLQYKTKYSKGANIFAFMVGMFLLYLIVYKLLVWTGVAA